MEFLPAEFLWKLFEQTGSITVYMIYRKLSIQ
ncbi:MAG: YqzL family protein [Dehalobacterium sp.]